MPKIAIIGAGSAVFSKNIIADVLWHPALRTAEIVLMDVDSRRLEICRRMAESINSTLGANATLRATTDLAEALAGADFVICTIGVGGAGATRIDLEVPLKFGLNQIIGDTLGVGGIFRSARSIPEVLKLCRLMEKKCPNALLMNYANPMAMHMLAIHRSTPVRAVGLCHGVVYTATTMRMLVAMKDVPAKDVDAHFRRPWRSAEREEEWKRWFALGRDENLSYTCAGINHMAAFLRFESGGRDLYPELRQVLDQPAFHQFDPVRFDLFRWLGYFMTETSAHCSEYIPYYLKNEAERSRCNLPVAAYIETVQRLSEDIDRLEAILQSGAPVVAADYSLSVEYASRIINAIVTDRPFVFNGNVHNRGGALISNLPGDSCVEVPCVAGRAGITPTYIGELPPQVAALIRTNINVQDLAVRGILERSKDYLYQAAMLDPNTAATLTLSQIKEVMDALFEAHAANLPSGFRFQGICHLATT